MNARYVAIGSLASHVHVVEPCLVFWLLRMPFEIASVPAGTEIAIVNEALSRGWSLAGNHVAATCGSPIAMAPSSVWMNPESPKSSRVNGTPSYVATTVNVAPLVIPCFGVTVSSLSTRFVAAVVPFTVTLCRSSPMKSRLKADRFWVAFAVIVATPVSWSVAGS